MIHHGICAINCNYVLCKQFVIFENVKILSRALTARCAQDAMLKPFTEHIAMYAMVTTLSVGGIVPDEHAHYIWSLLQYGFIYYDEAKQSFLIWPSTLTGCRGCVNSRMRELCSARR
jgi:hypothetical protein